MDGEIVVMDQMNNDAVLMISGCAKINPNPSGVNGDVMASKIV